MSILDALAKQNDNKGVDRAIMPDGLLSVSDEVFCVYLHRYGLDPEWMLEPVEERVKLLEMWEGNNEKD